MGCNYYLVEKQTKKNPMPQAYHICKLSWGWKPSFQSNTIDKYPYPHITTLGGYKNLYDSGDYILVNEENEILSWEKFMDLVERYDSPDNKNHYDTYYFYPNEEGYAFTSTDFC